MKILIRPRHEAILAGLLMVLALIGLGFIVAHEYAGRLPDGVVAEMYRTPVQDIRDTCGRIQANLGSFVSLGDLDKLYEERVVAAPTVDTVPDGDEPTVVDPIPEQDVEFRVTGIAWSSSRPMAFVNGRGVVPGDVIRGWAVAHITESSVTLTDEDGNEQQVGLYTKQGAPLKREKPVDDALRGELGGTKAESDAAY